MGLPLQSSTAQAEEGEKKAPAAGEEGFKGYCGAKRKAEEEDGPYQREEEAAVVVREQYQQGAADDATTDEMYVLGDGYDYDSDDDVETVIAKVKARWFDAVIERNRRWLCQDDSDKEEDSV